MKFQGINEVEKETHLDSFDFSECKSVGKNE